MVANSRRELEAGLDRRGSDDRFDEDDFDKGTEGLPEDAVVRTYFNLQRLIAADPDTADARKVKWVSALRTFGLSASTGSDKIDIDFNMGTDSGDLTDADLPLAAGNQSPEVAKRAGEFGFGLRGIDQIVKFAESAGQAVDPGQFGSYETAKRTIERQLKLDLEKDVLEQLSGDITASASPSGSSVGLKAEVKDPDAFKATLASVTKVLPAIVRSTSGGERVTIRKSGDLYSATLGDRSDRLRAGRRRVRALRHRRRRARHRRRAHRERGRRRGRVRHAGRCRPGAHARPGPVRRLAGRRRAGRAAVRRPAG